LNDVIDGLTALAIPVVHHPPAGSLSDTYAQITELGAATGHELEANNLIDDMRTEMEGLSTSVADTEHGFTYYHELDSFLYTVTSETFVGQVNALAGLENIADAAEGADALYPQLSAEYIVEQDPDFIFLADTKCCGQSPETVAARPGWNELTAVQDGSVVPLDDDVASRWGPRIVDHLTVVVESVDQLTANP